MGFLPKQQHARQHGILQTDVFGVLDIIPRLLPRSGGIQLEDCGSGRRTLVPDHYQYPVRGDHPTTLGVPDRATIFTSRHSEEAGALSEAKRKRPKNPDPSLSLRSRLRPRGLKPEGIRMTKGVVRQSQLDNTQCFRKYPPVHVKSWT